MTRSSQIRLSLIPAMILVSLLLSCSKAAKAPDSVACAAETGAEPAFAASGSGETAATVSYLEEPVTILRGDSKAGARLGDALMVGDVIITGANARCSIEIAGIGSIDIKEASSVRIDGVILAERRGAVSLATGSVVAKVRKLAAPDAFVVRAGSIACGVRGTEFTLTRKTNGTVSLSVATGKVSVFPDALITSGLHASATVVSVKANAPVSELALDSIMKKLPVVESGGSFEVSPKAFESAGRLIESEAARYAKEGATVPGDDLLQALRDIGAFVHDSTDVEEGGKDATREPRSAAGPGYSYTVTPIEPPMVREESGDFWPRPEPVHARAVEKKIHAPMDPSSTLLLVNEKAAGKAATSFVDGRSYIEILQNNANEWLALVESRTPVPLSKDSIYLLEFTAWAADRPMRLYACLNEGGRDDNGDGDAYTPYITRLVPVDDIPRRYSFVYQYRGIDNSQARFNVSAGNTAGGVYIQDITCRDLNARPLAEESEAGNLVRNGDFARGFLGWDVLDNAGFDLFAFSVVGGRFRYASREKQVENWHAQACIPVSLSKGKKYRLRFDARLSGNGNLTIGLEEFNIDRNRDGNRFSPEAPYLGLELSDDGWFTYEFDFTATASDPRSRLTFNFGGLAGTLLIDNVSLVKR